MNTRLKAQFSPKSEVPPFSVIGRIVDEDPEISPSPVHPEISIVVPAFNEAGNIATAIETIGDEFRRLKRLHEIIIVDDGSQDETIDEARKMMTHYPVRIICLSRNFGKENAITAGLKKAKGKAVIIMDADLQEPVSYLKTFLAHWEEGFEMVYSTQENRSGETFIKKQAVRLYYWLLNKTTSVTIPAHSRDFRLMDRKVVDAICALPEHNRFMKGLYSWVGFKSLKVPIILDRRTAGISKFRLKDLFGLAMTGLTSFSTFPLRMWTGIGFFVSVASLFFALFVTLKTIIFGADVAGWPTLTVAIFFLGGIQLFSIGILGEYIGRIFSEVKSRPGHIVAQKPSLIT
ncbi:MAG: glycosyltransferase involved in cell wall biosynthesis [Akkermansiaceae bacterium]|jgi:glycosyltransferase involved in cell wall biosynthesis